MKNLIFGSFMTMLFMVSCQNPGSSDGVDDTLVDTVESPMHPNEDTATAPPMIDTMARDTIM